MRPVIVEQVDRNLGFWDPTQHEGVFVGFVRFDCVEELSAVRRFIGTVGTVDISIVRKEKQ